MIFDAIANLTTNAGNTVSIEMSYETQNGGSINLNDCDVTFSLYDVENKTYLFESREIAGNTLIIPSEESIVLQGRYLIKVKIDNNDYIENYNIALLVKF